jgi:hypothetical protein
MDISTPTRRRISINNNDNNNIRNEFESIDEDDNENQSIRDDAQIIPKRRQSRATSSNNRIDSVSNIKTEQIEEIPSSMIDVYVFSSTLFATFLNCFVLVLNIHINIRYM